MTDNTQLRNSSDGKRINLNEAREVQYWTKTLNVSEEKLKQVIKRVGPSAGAVRNAIGR